MALAELDSASALSRACVCLAAAAIARSPFPAILGRAAAPAPLSPMRVATSVDRSDSFYNLNNRAVSLSGSRNFTTEVSGTGQGYTGFCCCGCPAGLPPPLCFPVLPALLFEVEDVLPERRRAASDLALSGRNVAAAGRPISSGSAHHSRCTGFIPRASFTLGALSNPQLREIPAILSFEKGRATFCTCSE